MDIRGRVGTKKTVNIQDLTAPASRQLLRGVADVPRSPGSRVVGPGTKRVSLAGTRWGRGAKVVCSGAAEAGPRRGNVGETPGRERTWAVVECSGRQGDDPHVSIKCVRGQTARSSPADEGPSQRVKAKESSGQTQLPTAPWATEGDFFHVASTGRAGSLASGHGLVRSVLLPAVRWGLRSEPQTPPSSSLQRASNSHPQEAWFQVCPF